MRPTVIGPLQMCGSQWLMRLVRHNNALRSLALCAMRPTRSEVARKFTYEALRHAIPNNAFLVVANGTF